MHFFADEGCDGNLVDALRRNGHDVRYAAEELRGSHDTTLLELAQAESRIFITEDKDFGELVYRTGQAHSGVIFFRLSVDLRHTKPQRVLQLIQVHGAKLKGAFVVIQNKQSRVRLRPFA